MIWQKIVFFFILLSMWHTAADGQSHFNIAENDIVETYWRYTYSRHLETNTVVHQAEKGYDHIVCFQHDKVYRSYFNGQLTTGSWSLDGNKLQYPFKKVTEFVVVKATAHTLELEFTPTQSRGAFIYHFIKDDRARELFPKREGELPEVVVVEKKHKIKAFAKAKGENAKAKKSETNISVELVGGGYYGGIDPVLRDNIVINGKGRLIKEFKSMQHGLVVTKKDIPIEELEAFGEWAKENNFFELNRQYDCASKYCEKRKFVNPRPVPLRLAITYGTQRKIVTISIWGRDKNGEQYVDYPPELDNIIDAIQRMASR